MKSKKLTIQINRNVRDVFTFTTDPKNTPFWIDSIVFEETNEWPVKIGTKYKNKNRKGVWQEYKVTGFEKDKVFVLSSTSSTYHVKYTFTPIDSDTCELEYNEWMDEGELDEPFTQDVLIKLKRVLEG